MSCALLTRCRIPATRVVASFLALVPHLASNAVAQAPPSLASSDSLAIRAASLAILLERIREVEVNGQRIWLRPDRADDPAQGRRVLLGGPSPSELESLKRRFPSLELLPYEDDPFVCPPGVEVYMPLIGCPIREDGIVVELSSPRRQGNRVIAGGSVTRSWTSSLGVQSAMTSYELLFERDDEGWRFVGVGRIVTT